ncbi:conserved hypothetical protein, partial [Listeria seeligeri FSL N1-067]
SAIFSAKVWSWVTIICVMPTFFKLKISAATWSRKSGSSAEVGSSKRSTFGFIASARAIATRCFCPPDNWYGMLSALSAKSSNPSNRSASFLAISFFVFRASVGAKIKLSITLKCGNK